MKNVKIIADSTCDLSMELLKKYDISIIPLCILLDMDSYLDGSEIAPEQIYKWADEHQKTPKTAATPPEKVMEVLKPFVEDKRDIIFFGISEEMSTTCNVVRLMASEIEYNRIFVINSESLSTGIGLQVIKAAILAEEGKSAEEIVHYIENNRSRVSASFVVDKLTYLARGGRCSQVTALLANTLQLKPRIEVVNGKMGVGKKYRGSLKSVVMKYVQEKKEELCCADKSCIFITHSGIEDDIISDVKNYLLSFNRFEEIYVTRAGGVVSSHCGPGTLGVLYYEGR